MILMLLLIVLTIIMIAYNNTSDGNLGLPIKMIYALIVGLFILSLVNLNKKEHFELLIGNDEKQLIKKVDLQHFFQFIEYYQTVDMDLSAEIQSYASCDRESESIKIGNNIRNLLQMLHFIVSVNDQDNFYNRFIVMKVGTNVDYDKQHPVRKQNYDELVRNKIGKEFTFLPSNEYDNYYPRPNIDSKYQYPLPNNINVHNYYTYENTEVNLLALQMLLELVHSGDINVFEDLYRPTEYITFNSEFMVPLKSIKNSVLEIVNTNAYREYLKNYKFADKYKDIIYTQGLLNLF